MNLPNLHKLLKERSGDTWEVHFTSEQFGIDEMVTLEVPRLLPQDIIDKIKKRSESNKTFTHGQAKHQYLLARMIFCEECGMALFGQANKHGRLYYRHSRTDHCKKPNAYLPADLIEANVLSDIIRMFGDKPAMERAAKAAIPNIKESEELQLTISQAEKALAKIERDIEKILDMVVAGSISQEDVKKRMAKLDENRSRLLSDRELSKAKLQSIPKKADITRRSAFLLRLTQDILKSENHYDMG
jgi:hypothetical protein